MSLQTKPETRGFAATRFTASIERRVLNYIRKYGVITAGERVVVAISGGPDSTALLVILARLAPKLRFDVMVAHFDHRLRTEEEAAADLDFVRSLASSLCLPLVHSGSDVRAYARERHVSIEDAARRLRYKYLAEEAAIHDAGVVAVGHTIDDQAETVLLHLIRGSGLTGLSGMQQRAQWPFHVGPALARPLLALRREETDRYCVEIGISPRQDPTNELPTATRNRVRHELMPVLRRLNPRIQEALARLSATARADSEYLDELASHAFNSLAKSDGPAVSVSRRELAALPRPLSSRLIRLAYARAHDTATDLESAHIEAVLRAVDGPPGNHSLPGAVTVTLHQSELTISRGPIAGARRIEVKALSVPGDTEAGVWLIETSHGPAPDTIARKNPFEACLDADVVGTDLTVRSRRPGDRLRPLGLGGEKKLQDILVDAKVPAGERDGVPLVCAGAQIAWVVGQCIDERFALSSTSSRGLYITATEKEL